MEGFAVVVACSRVAARQCRAGSRLKSKGTWSGVKEWIEVKEAEGEAKTAAQKMMSKEVE
jgi:hypothetical protein